MLLLSVEDEDEDGLPLRVGWLQDWNKLLELIHEAKSTSFAGNPQFLEQSPSTAALNCCSQLLLSTAALSRCIAMNNCMRLTLTLFQMIWLA